MRREQNRQRREGDKPWRQDQPQGRAGWFEQVQRDPAAGTAAPAAGEEPEAGTLVRARRRTRWAWLLSALAVTLATGMALGFAVGSARPSGEPASAPPTQPAQPPQTSIVVRPTASSACLETAKRGDQMIQLLITNQRDRASHLLVAYTVASRQCRRDASP